MLEERAQAAGRRKPSLADHYNPLAMAPELLRAHAQLDRAVDRVFNLTKPTEAERLAALFASYQKLMAAEERTKTAGQLRLPKV